MKYFLGFFSVILPAILFAGGHTPPRPTRGPGPPPGLPVDQYIYILLIIAVMISLIYHRNKKLQS